MKRKIVIVALLSMMLFTVALTAAWGPNEWQPPDGRNIEEEIFSMPEMPLGTLLGIFICFTALVAFATYKHVK